MKEIETKTNIDSIIRIPGSKSVTHRSLITAALADGESLLDCFLACEDTIYTLKALQVMGAGMDHDGEIVRIKGTGGQLESTPSRKEIYLGNSGTSYRLLLSIAALARGEHLFTGNERMKERPIKDLVQALNQVGVETGYTEKEGYPPVLINASGIHGGKALILGDKSSQYISSLLLAGPYAEKGVEIEVVGELVSRPYVDVTLDVMNDFGVQVERDDYRYFKVPAGKPYMARNYTIDGDVSSASYFWGAAAITRGRVITENIHPEKTRQGDIALLDVLEEMGCKVTREPDRVIVEGGELSGIDVDMSSMPDMVPTLASVALFAKGTTFIRNVAHLRIKESDRLSVVAQELGRIGGLVMEKKDGLIIQGKEKLSGAVINPHDDHRIAMSLAMAGLAIPGIMIEDEVCVSKSFPGFWDALEAL